MDVFNYECEGQLSITDYLKSKVVSGNVKDLTSFINSKGESQYEQIEKIVLENLKGELVSDEVLGNLINKISIYVLNQSLEYMDYLKQQCKL